MATVIDELVVTLGLDPRNLSEGQRKAAQEWLKAKENARAGAKDIEGSAAKVERAIDKVRDQTLALFAVFTAGRGLKEFVEDTVDAESAMGRLAITTDQSVSTLSSWANIGPMVGGTLAGMAKSMQGLVQNMQTFALTGQSSVIPYFRALNVNLSDASTGRMRSVSSILLDLADRFHGMDPARAAAFGNAIGLDEGMINLLIQGRSAVEGYLEEQKKLGVVSEKDAAAAMALKKAHAELDQAWETSSRRLLTQVTLALIGLANVLTRIAEWFSAHPTAFATAFFVLSTAATTLSAALTILAVKGTFDIIAAGLVAIGLGADVALGPLGLMLAALTAIVAATVWLFNHGYLHTAADGASGTYKPTTTSYKNAGEVGGERTGGAGYRDAGADVDALVRMGWSRDQATGIVANISRESGGVLHAQGDGGQAYGLGQWHGTRQAAFAAWAGFDIRDPRATRQKQLEFINYELRYGSERRAGLALGGAGNAAEAAAIVSSQYERPGDRVGEMARRSQRALALSGGGGSSKTVTVHNETHVGKVEVHTPTNDPLAHGKAAAGAMQTTLASQANTGAQ